MASNEKLYEEYGFKADAQGFFPQWRILTSSILDNNPKIKPLEAAEKAYFELVGSKR